MPEPRSHGHLGAVGSVVVTGIAVAVLTVPRGPVREQCAGWQRLIR